jgi:hypothetical protein
MVDEYIRQQDAIDDLHTQLMYRMGTDDMKRRLDDWVKTLPSADVVPVVRCKECKFRENDDFCTGRGFPCQLVPDDGFCDKGGRKE